MDFDTITFANGAKYRTHDALSSSYGSIGVANIRALLPEFAGRVDAWSQLQLHDESRGRATQCGNGRAGRAGRASCGLHCVPEHRLPTDDCLLVTDALGTESMYLLSPDFDRLIAALNDYPSIDDVVLSEVEEEWKKEAWEGWIKDALFRFMKDPLLRDWAGEFLDDGVLYAHYRASLDTTGVYPEIEQRAVCLDVRRIVTAFEQNLRSEVKQEYDRSFNFAETSGC